MYFKLIRVYNLETKSELWWKCWHYIMDYIIKLGSIFFLFVLVSNLAYIEYLLCQIWSIYMQYLRCYDHCNKCLFPVIQLAEVLLNFWRGVYLQIGRLDHVYSHSTHMMTSSNGKKSRVTGPLCGEFTGHRWIPHTMASDAKLWCFLWYAPEQTVG